MADKIFTNEKDRGDFFIALIVLALFGSLLFGRTFFNNDTAEETALVAHELDADGDGVSNENDECPNQYGTNVNGCPVDSDLDGVYDYIDQCPNQEGSAENYGCPVGMVVENHNAIIGQTARLTPVVPIIVNENAIVPVHRGCTESCKEKMAAKIRACQEGCLDEACKEACETRIKAECLAQCSRDGNAHVGCEPGCTRPCCANRETAAIVSATDADQIDSDGDGVVDREDLCPEQAGSIRKYGCPEIEQYAIDEEDSAILRDAISNVQFETAKDVLLPNSLIVLNRIVGLMEKYPEAKLQIDGHTDNVGDVQNNLQLSRERAISCKNYLVSQGISTERITTNGYGQALPTASNNTENGRRINRRVEFNLYK